MADSDNLKNIKVTEEMMRRAQENAMSGIIDKDNPELTYKILKENAKEFRDSFNKELKKLKFEELGKKLQNELLSDAKEALKPKQGFFKRVGAWLNESGSREDLASQYRARQVAGGLESMFGGNFLSGVRQIGSAFPKIANFMGGPYYIALEMTVRGLLKLDDALAKATKTAASMTGGLQSNYLNRSGFSSIAFNRNLRQDLYNIGMQGEFENISSALIKGYGMGSYQGRQQDYITSMAYAQKGLGSLGVSADTTNNLLSNLRLLDNKDTTSIYAQLKRLSDNVVKMKYLSPDEAMRQMSSLFDQTKMLGINFEWANRAITQFEKGLKDGTISLSDFAAVNRSLRSGGISKNAGIAEMVIDYASRSGLNLPQNLISSDPLGRGFALSTKSMLSNNQFALAYQGTIQEKIDQMGGATKQDKAARLQYFLSQLGVNIGPEAAESAIRSNGQIDLIGSKILGTRMGEKEEEERKKAEKYEKEVESYYKGTTSWHKGVLDKMDKLINNTGSRLAQGASGEVTGEGTWYQVAMEAVGYSLTKGLWQGLDQMMRGFKQAGSQNLIPPTD